MNLNADEAIVPQISDLQLGVSAASLYGAFPGTLRDALRQAGSSGLFWTQIVDALGSEIKHELKAHSSAINNALDYLVAVGLARREGARWYEIPVIVKRSNP